MHQNTSTTTILQEAPSNRRARRSKSNSSLEGFFPGGSAATRRSSRRRSNSSLEGFFPDDCSADTISSIDTDSSVPTQFFGSRASFCSEDLSVPEEVMPSVSEEPTKKCVSENTDELRKLTRRLRTTKRRLLLQSAGMTVGGQPVEQLEGRSTAVNQLRGLLLELSVERPEDSRHARSMIESSLPPSHIRQLGPLPNQNDSKVATIQTSSSFDSNQILKHSPSPSAA